MDINVLNGQIMNTSYVPFSSASPLPEAAEVISGTRDSFQDILQRAQSAGGSSAFGSGTVRESESHAAPVLNRPEIDENDKLYEMCLELETFLIKNLIKGMRSTVQKSELIDTGFAGGMYEDMLYDEYAKSFAKNANFGFAEMAYRELSAIGQSADLSV